MSEIIKVTVIGAAGRMGSQIVQVIINADGIELVGAIEAKEGFVGHTVPGTEVLFTLSGRGESRSLFSESDVIIDVSDPKAAMKHITLALETEKPLVIGTTGLDDETTDYLKRVTLKIPCVLAPNFSLIVNLQFTLMAKITAILKDHDIEIVEEHHKNKGDAPSGTAIRLAEIAKQIRGGDINFVHGRQGKVGPRKDNEIGIHAVRGGSIFGTHKVLFAGFGGNFRMITEINSRDEFAQGAVWAAERVVGWNPGLYDMQDVYDLRANNWDSWDL